MGLCVFIKAIMCCEIWLGTEGRGCLLHWGCIIRECSSQGLEYDCLPSPSLRPSLYSITVFRCANIHNSVQNISSVSFDYLHFCNMASSIFFICEDCDFVSLVISQIFYCRFNSFTVFKFHFRILNKYDVSVFSMVINWTYFNHS